MNAIKATGISLALFGAASAAYGSGFGLYQPSAVSHAMGGALVGKAMDASANFNNPATLTDLTNMQFTVGFVTEHPRGRVDANVVGLPERTYDFDPGMFIIPHFQLAIPLPAGFTFGFGAEPDYGLGSQFDDGWLMHFSTTDTKIQSMALTPNIAYKIIDDWSVGVGLRWIYFEFEQYSFPLGYGHPMGANRLRGDNGMNDFGWQVGTKYDITDTFSVGLVYKSAIDVGVDGKTTFGPIYGPASADITLPQSIAGGFNWDVFSTWHVGAVVSWTEWSEFDNLHFNLPAAMGGGRDTRLDWRDTWRGSIGSCWDFAEDWKWLVSYTYDMDATTWTQQSTMLPPADRHILGTGFSWNLWKGLELSVSYACIFMAGGDMRLERAGTYYDLKTRWGFCHAAGASITYRF